MDRIKNYDPKKCCSNCPNDLRKTTYSDEYECYLCNKCLILFLKETIEELDDNSRLIDMDGKKQLQRIKALFEKKQKEIDDKKRT